MKKHGPLSPEHWERKTAKDYVRECIDAFDYLMIEEIEKSVVCLNRYKQYMKERDNLLAYYYTME